MDYYGICRICGDRITFNADSIYLLGKHLITKHPELEMTHFVVDSGDGGGCFPDSQNQIHEKSCISVNANKPSVIKSNLYKTTVETWRPGCAPIRCPRCRHCGQPIIRKQRNKVAYNSLGAFFLLGCWPLCFLPMVMCGSTKISICCKNCGYCIGTYDPKSGILEKNDCDCDCDC